MRPALLSFIESLVDGCIIADERSFEDFFVDDCRERLSIFVNPVEGDGDVLELRAPLGTGEEVRAEGSFSRGTQSQVTEEKESLFRPI